MFIKLKKFINPFLLSLTLSLSAFAETSTNQIIETNLTDHNPLDIFKNVSGSIGFGYESDFYEFSATEKEQALNLQLEFIVKHNDWKYGLSSVVSKRLLKQEKAEIGDARLFVIKPLAIFAKESSFSSSLSASVALPTSQESRYEQEMYLNFSIGPSLTWNKDNLSFFLIPRIGKIFNKYKTSYNGENNTSYYSKVSIASSYQVLNSLSTQFTTSITQAWTDNHVRKLPTYASELSTDLKLASQLTFSLTVSINDKIYKSDGTSANIKIFDKNLSAYSVALTKDF